MHIGQIIQQVIKQKRVSVTWLAAQMPCDRSNIYNIFRRKDISTEILKKLSILIDYDFFAPLSAEVQDELKSNKGKKRSK